MTPTTILPKPHQAEARTRLTAALAAGGRAQMIAACGTGKTLVGRWVAEDIQPTRVLVVLPSLMLVAQTLAEWRRVPGWSFEAFVCCSDPGTTAGVAERAGADGSDVDEHYWAKSRAGVSTSPGRVARRLADAGPERPLVVFSTYHSLPVVMAAAEQSGHEFDLVIFDEAHHLAGQGRATWRRALHDTHLPSRRRLFMTATPGLTPSGAGAMDDPDLYGRVAYQLTFAEAIDRGLLVDYRVVVVEATESSDTTHSRLSTLAAAGSRGASRVITFHGRVAKAKAFAEAIDGQRLSDGRRLQGDWISGKQPQRRRAALLERLAAPPESTLAVLSNARCLSEGVDVPAVDAVMFCDPKDSAIDVVQAVGRALRPAPGKTQGLIILPVELDGVLDDDTALATGPFAGVWRVLRHLMGLDERLAADVRAARRDLLQKNRSPRLSRVDVADGLDLSEILTRLVSGSHTDWNRFYQHLWTYSREHGSVIALPAHHLTTDGATLGRWADAQRTAMRRGTLSLEHIALLEDVPGWFWNADAATWHQEYARVAGEVHVAGGLDLRGEMALRRIATQRQHGQAPTLGRWCARQRIARRRGELDPRRQELLEQLPGWSWAPVPAHDVTMVDLLAEWVNWKSDANVASGTVEDDLPLGDWLSEVRRRRATDRLDLALLDELEEVTPKKSSPGALMWKAREVQWLLGYEALRQYVTRTGRCQIPEGHVEQLPDTDVALYVWCRRQRHLHRHDRLHPQCVQALETVLGWRWEIPLRTGDRVTLEGVEHGTRTAYVKGCKCDPCTDANRAKQAERDARTALGLPATDLVDATRARAHLRILQGQGASMKALSRVADLNVKTLIEIAEGRRDRVLPETETTVLALTIQAARLAAAPGSRIPAGPTWEKLDELIGRGWPKAWLARELGFTSGLQLSRDEISASNAAKVEGLRTAIGDLRPPARRFRQPMPTLAEILDSTSSQARPSTQNSAAS